MQTNKVFFFFTLFFPLVKWKTTPLHKFQGNPPRNPKLQKQPWSYNQSIVKRAAIVVQRAKSKDKWEVKPYNQPIVKRTTTIIQRAKSRDKSEKRNYTSWLCFGIVSFVTFRRKNGEKFVKLFYGLSFGRTFFSFLSRV
jgi:hypothetical protein